MTVGRNGKNTNIGVKRVGTDAVTKVKTNPCRHIHPHLPGVITGIAQRSANAASTTKEKRTNTNTKERGEIVMPVVAQVDHHLHQMLIQ